jgi:hypothetical protein
MRRLLQRALLAASACALLLAAACGGGGGDGEAPASAALVPADAPLYLSVVTDEDSDQWRAASALLERFPGGGEALAGLVESLEQEGISATQELLPALRPEVALVALDLRDTEEPPFLLIAKPDDPAAFERLLASGDPRPAWRVEDGWYLVAESEQLLERAERGAASGSLAQREEFERSFGSLPDDALVRLYLDGRALATAGASGLEQGAPLEQLPAVTGAPLEAIALALAAEEQGVRIDGVVLAGGGLEAEAFRPQLPSLVPADALLYAGFADVRLGLTAVLEAVAREEEGFDAELSQVELALGVDLDRDVLSLFAGENALFLQAGAPLPSVTLVLSPQDPQAALATIDKIVAGIPRLAEAAGETAPFTVRDTTIAGLPAKELDLADENDSVFYALVDGRIAVSTSVNGIADLVAGAPHLADHADYRAAVEAAGLPDETSGVLYVDIAGALVLADAFDLELPEEALANLRPLRSLVAWAEAGEQELRFSGFVRVE